MGRKQIINWQALAGSWVMNASARYGNSGGGFHLPEIADEDRIRVKTPKTRKHATKRRGNKLHDKKTNRRHS
jgi:hypothetical protein